MSRPIKFRAWDVFAKEMDYEVTIDPDGKVAAFNPLDGQYVRGFSEDEKVLMQYTGLKDRNGKEIYEGDILRDDRGIGEVEWVQEHCAYMIFTKEPSFYYHMESDGVLKNTEIIGNIYENTSLLEDTP
ncbi:YopX protein [compost metagenome]